MAPAASFCFSGQFSEMKGPLWAQGKLSAAAAGPGTPQGPCPELASRIPARGGNNPGGGELPGEGISLPVPPASQLSWLFFFFFNFTPPFVSFILFHPLFFFPLIFSPPALPLHKDGKGGSRAPPRVEPPTVAAHAVTAPLVAPEKGALCNDNNTPNSPQKIYIYIRRGKKKRTLSIPKSAWKWGSRVGVRRPCGEGTPPSRTALLRPSSPSRSRYSSARASTLVRLCGMGWVFWVLFSSCYYYLFI